MLWGSLSLIGEKKLTILSNDGPACFGKFSPSTSYVLIYTIQIGYILHDKKIKAADGGMAYTAIPRLTGIVMGKRLVVVSAENASIDS